MNKVAPIILILAFVGAIKCAEPASESRVATDLDKPQIRVPESEAQFLLAAKFTQSFIQAGRSDPAKRGWQQASILLQLYHGGHVPDAPLEPGPAKDFYAFPPPCNP